MGDSVDTHSSVNELDVLGALRVTVASSILGTSLVRREARHTTVGVHLREVDGTVETTGEVRHVDIEGELHVLHVERRVLRVAVHQVDARPDVGRARGIRDEVELERAAGRCDTVGALVVRTVESAVSSAGRWVGTESSVPGVAGVAVRVPGDIVHPAPVGVEDDLAVDSRAAGFRAGLIRQGRVGLSRDGTDLLSANATKGDESEGEQCAGAEHVEVGKLFDRCRKLVSEQPLLYFISTLENHTNPSMNRI